MVSLLPANTLSNVRVGVSASPSPDLARLGLLEQHFRLALGELARTVLVLGGALQYCGHLDPDGYTPFLIGELKRYGLHDDPLSVILAWASHRRLTLREIQQAQVELGLFGSVRCLDLAGVDVDPAVGREAAPPVWLTIRLRRHSRRCVELRSARRKDVCSSGDGDPAIRA